MHQAFMLVRAKILDHLLQVPVVGAAEVLRGLIDLGELLQERGSRVVRARPPGVCGAGLAFSLPLAHGLHEAAGHGCILRDLEDNGNLVLQQRQLFLMKQESLGELFGAQSCDPASRGRPRRRVAVATATTATARGPAHFRNLQLRLVRHVRVFRNG